MSLDDYMMEYLDKFGEGFPMYQLGRGRSQGEIIEMIKDCLENSLDVYEMGFLALPDDEEY